MRSDAAIKHKQFAREYVKSGYNGTKAYSKVYPLSTKPAAKSSATKLLTSPLVQETIASTKQIINEQLSGMFLARRLKNLCGAKKKIFYEGNEVGSDADNPTRLGAVRTALQIHGALDPENILASNTPIIQINMVTAQPAQE